MWPTIQLSYASTFTVSVITHPPLHLHSLSPETDLTHIVLKPVHHQVMSAVGTKLKNKNINMSIGNYMFLYLKSCLDAAEWCFVEHFDKKMLKVLRN